jgi:hypothetical protein
MLLMFSGKGCYDCPFYWYNEIKDWPECNISKWGTADGYEIPELRPGGIKPKDCPFAQSPGTVEIQAEEHD